MQNTFRPFGRLAASLAALFLVMTVLVPVWAADAEFRTVSTQALKDMLDEKQAFTLIDARTKEEYQEAHIGKAVNISEKDFDAVVSTLPAGKGALLVFYCNGVKCGKSKKVAEKARRAGYTNILLYSEGFPVWEEKGMPIVAGPDYAKKIQTNMMSAATLKEVLSQKKGEYVLVDVRDEFEFAEGHVEGAINIPAESFAVKSGGLPKEKGIIVYCNSGGRSYMAYRKLMKLAYPKIYQAIFDEWKKAGYPVVKSQL
ncbi:rhodanese-like domain-containing protein [Geomesophilobacter sediminis]|uniref:Rhodanese-like domain-containing protein n=1 Tax=Geomesophilobacter sediminis TaxID=2798584 RepID=A0A8J7M0K0_9BACT|nr:rhodanese-like domain-containing protein [Geomesophilobacter sediminis]MBJ6725592.1 rhodanese-like domain-containing protein [Geomesophilobacter sediminis]